MTRFAQRVRRPATKGNAMKLRLIALAATAALGLGTMPGAQAALPPQITDPAGDAKGNQAAYDVVSVTFDTIKAVSYKTVKVGKKKKAKRVAVYTPTDFTITMTMAAPPDVKPGTSYQIMAAETPCGLLYAYTYFALSTAGRRDAMQFGDCGPTTTTGDNFVLAAGQFTATVVGNSIVWKAPLKNLPKEVKLTSAFAGLSAYTAPTEPVFGYSGVDFADSREQAEAASFDFAASDKVYKLGS